MTTNLSSIKGGASSSVKVLTANDVVAVPAWAVAVRVTAVGGGQGGGINLAAGSAGNGGHAGAAILGLTVPLFGCESITVAVGAGGDGYLVGPYPVDVPPQKGGDTRITFNGPKPRTLKCEGGGNGPTATASARPYWEPYAGTGSVSTAPLGLGGTSQPSSPFSAGALGVTGGGSPGSGFGAHSPFGSGGEGVYTLNAFPADTFNDAVGYGAGGGGGNSTYSGTTNPNQVGHGGKGAPGFVMLEFLAGL